MAAGQSAPPSLAAAVTDDLQRDPEVRVHKNDEGDRTLTQVDVGRSQGVLMPRMNAGRSAGLCETI